MTQVMKNILFLVQKFSFSQIPTRKKISRKIKKYLCVQGKGEFTMEYKEHSPVSNDVQAQLVKNYKGTTAAE